MRVVAHRLGVGLGVVMGLVFFPGAMRALFIGGMKDWIDVILWLADTLSVLSFLPLSVLGWFRPRAAAVGFATALAAFLSSTAALVILGYWTPYWTVSGVVKTLLFFVFPLLAVAWLFFYASSPEPAGPAVAASPGPDRLAGRILQTLSGGTWRGMTRLLAIALALAVGAWRLPHAVWLLHGPFGFRRMWPEVAVLLPDLMLVPVGALAIVKPRLAAYVAWGSVVVPLVVPVIVSGVLSGFALMMAAVWNLPLLLVGALLFYASAERGELGLGNL